MAWLITSTIPSLIIGEQAGRHARPVGSVLGTATTIDLLLALFDNPDPTTCAEPVRPSLEHLDRVVQRPDTTRGLDLHPLIADSRLLQRAAHGIHEPDVLELGPVAQEAGARLYIVKVRVASYHARGHDFRVAEL